jgi:hypothetical protein
MTDYIKLARQAGIDVLEVESERASMWPATPEGLAKFAELVQAAERERCARLCEPTAPRPCDCERCDCGNATDARMVAEWDEAAAMAKRIRGPNTPISGGTSAA